MIQLFHVLKVFPGDSPALSDVSLHIGKGEFVFLTGHSGAGKTTLLKLLFCDEKPSQGQVLIDGCNLAGLRRSAIPALGRKIGVVFQDFRLLADRTVVENDALPLNVTRWPSAECEKGARSIQQRLDLTHKSA